MSYVHENLYLGSIDDACNVNKLKKNGITHILTLDSRPLARHVSEQFQCMFVQALDMETTDLLSHFPDCIQFIENARDVGAILVHCVVGQSRSATVVLAYLMHKMDLSLDDARTVLMKRRPQIRPNNGFLKQLELFETMGNKLDQNHQEYKEFRLTNLARKIQTAQIHDRFPEGTLSEDPTQSAGGGECLFKCKKCRRPLFRQCATLCHMVGKGEAAFDWGVNQDPFEPAEEEECHQSLFIEPVQWMENDILELEGKISCPKCRCKLGSFNWAGERCPCGRWVTPAFHMQMGKVDKSVTRGGPHFVSSGSQGMRSRSTRESCLSTTDRTLSLDSKLATCCVDTEKQEESDFAKRKLTKLDSDLGISLNKNEELPPV